MDQFNAWLEEPRELYEANERDRLDSRYEAVNDLVGGWAASNEADAEKELANLIVNGQDAALRAARLARRAGGVGPVFWRLPPRSVAAIVHPT